MSWSIDDAATYEREVGGLTRFLKAFKGHTGTIITWDTEREITQEGITIRAIPIWKWLLNDDHSV